MNAPPTCPICDHVMLGEVCNGCGYRKPTAAEAKHRRSLELVEDRDAQHNLERFITRLNGVDPTLFTDLPKDHHTPESLFAALDDFEDEP